LLDLGHKRIAFLAGPPGTPWNVERFEGYRRALREAGLEVDEKLVFQAGWTIEDGAKAALQMLNEATDATAVQAVNDLAAVGCVETLLHQSLRVPEDISVVGFGNVLLGEHCRVPLTTLRQAKFRLGVAAVEVMKLLLGGQKPEPRRLAADLVIRASSGIAPATSQLKQPRAANS
jgi:DNA-binding LacI/PurR family transcriptional regulator